MPVQKTAMRLEELETELFEIGETVQKALDRDFQEEYDVMNVSIDKGGLVVVSINLVPDEVEDE